MSISLNQAIQRVERLFPFVDYQDLDMSNTYIERLYHENGLFYKLLHSFAGSMHMTISGNASRGVRDHTIQVQKIAAQISSISMQSNIDLKVLELGCGKGYNVYHLAKQFPRVQFVGIDITESYIQESKSRTTSLENVTIQKMDMDKAIFDPASYHVVYDIETVCHTQDHQRLLSKIYTSLQQDGLFILFDNFRKGSLGIDQVAEQKALKYIELAVGIPNGIHVTEWLLQAQDIGFEPAVNTDLSQDIMFGLNRYHQMASIYFNNPVLAKMINKVIPEKLKLYSIGAYLMKYSMELGFQSYEEIVLKK